jgi:hypothetical protein
LSSHSEQGSVQEALLIVLEKEPEGPSRGCFLFLLNCPSDFCDINVHHWIINLDFTSVVLE